jgi:hypothetical protein
MKPFAALSYRAPIFRFGDAANFGPLESAVRLHVSITGAEYENCLRLLRRGLLGFALTRSLSFHLVRSSGVAIS